MTDKCLWTIMVPVSDNADKPFTVEYHREWDDKVRKIAGGLTINSTAKGVWKNGSGKVYKEAVIPVNIVATEPEIREIMGITVMHYKQESVMAYLVSDKALFLRRSEIE